MRERRSRKSQITRPTMIGTAIQFPTKTFSRNAPG